MNKIENKIFEEERALYGSHDLIVKNCSFDGSADGESAFKECSNVTAEDCFFNLRYPFWHNKRLRISNSEMTERCRAALWYTAQVEITNTKMHGIKALRECSDVMINNCDIISPEFGWSVKNINMQYCTVISEYFMMRSENINFTNVSFTGKYSFQYLKDSTFENCIFDTKDAFWHAENVTVTNSIIRGEYLAWYSNHVTLQNCIIIGTQPFCYCKNLNLVHCEMINADLCFEKSDVYAIITTPVVSIKNPLSGRIFVPSVQEIIRDDIYSKCDIIVSNRQSCQKSSIGISV